MTFSKRISGLALAAAALVATSGLAPVTVSAQTTTPTPGVPASCQMLYLGSLGVQCYRYDDAALGQRPGTDASAIAAPVPWCKEIAFGAVAQGVTPAPGQFECFQFVVTTQQAFEIKAQLDASTLARGQLFWLEPNGMSYRLAETQSPANPLVVNSSFQFRRMIYAVSASNTRFGKLFNVSLNAPVPPDRYTNTDRSKALAVEMERQIGETLPTPTSSAHYFFPLANGQKRVRLQYTITGNMQVAYALATRTGPGTYTAQSELTVAGPRTNGQNQVTSYQAVNTPTTTQPVGLLVRVTGTNPTAPVGEAYQVKAANDDAWLALTSFDNQEPISRWYPGVSGTLQIFSFVHVDATVKNQAGEIQRGKEVVVTVTPDTAVINYKLAYYYTTDVNGRISVDVPFPACTGTVTWKYNYTNTSNPASHWNGSAQKAIAVISLPMADGSPGLRLTSSINITRICQETYLGTY